MVASALFDINADGEDRGFQATAGQVLTLRLRPPVDSGVLTVLFQVWRAAGADDTLGIAANPPRASKGAPELTLVGSTSGQAVSPTTVGGNVTVTLPGAAGHSYLVRCVVNGGQRTLSSGKVVLDPTLIHHRGVWIPTGYATRKVVATERFEFEEEGFAGALSDLIELGGAASSTFVPSGLGAFSRAITGYLNEGISVLSFMSDAHRAAAIAGSFANDNRAAIQAAIDYAIYSSTSGSPGPGPRVHLGGARYRSDGPIHVGYGALSFSAMILEGEGMQYAGGGGTLIKFTHDDAPGLVVQGGRNVMLRDFCIEGVNYAHCVGLAQAPTMANLELETWIAAGLSNERYRPYVGIAIDPYAGVRPVDSYPDVDYPAYLGAVPQYGKEASSNTKIENVAIFGFVGGIGQQVCDYDGNGDYTKLERVQIFYCSWGMSWGNSQSRVMSWRGCTFVGMHTSMLNGMHGRQQGKPHVTIEDCEFSTQIQLMDIHLSFGQGPTFIGCYSEGTYKLGKVAGYGYAAGISFIGCEWGFSWWYDYGVPAALLENNSTALIRFVETTLYNPTGRGTFHFHAEGFDADLNQLEPARLFEFSGCSVLIRDAAAVSVGTANLWAKCAMDGTLGISIAYGSTCLERFSVQSGDTYDLDTGVELGPRLYSERNQGRRDRPLCVYTKRAASLATGNDPGVPVAWRVASITANGGIISQVGREIEFVVTGINATYLFQLGGDVGDVIICARTKAVFWVKARTSDHIFARAQTGFDVDGDLLMALVNGDVFYCLNCRRYMPAQVLYGDVTSGSPTISNVVDGFGGFPADIGAHIAADDYLFVDEEVDRILPALQASVVSFDNGAHTITMGANFTRTQTRLRLGPFVRQALPNAP